MKKPIYYSFTNDLYWDCECPNNYIHKKSESLECNICGYCEEDMPDSCQKEVEEGKHFASKEVSK